jgi:ABC-type phosphate/phosphonate transport system ATPase subunit
MMEVYEHFQFKCYLNNALQCIDPGSNAQYECDEYQANITTCSVKARETLSVIDGIGLDDNYWYYFGFLCCIFVGYKTADIILTIYPWERIVYWISIHFHIETSYKQVVEVGNNNSDKTYVDDNNIDNGVKNIIIETVEIKPEFKAIKSHHPVSSIEKEKFSLTWSNLNVILPNKNKDKLVDNVSGCVTSGRVLALMGSSGAGKTTLLNALANRIDYADVTGEILFSNRKVTSQDLTYVPQFDEVNGILTINEHIELVGKLTCVDVDAMLKRKETILEVLGLTSKKDVQVKYLSGGEKKRVCVAVGIISNPYVLFLDGF